MSQEERGQSESRLGPADTWINLTFTEPKYLHMTILANSLTLISILALKIQLSWWVLRKYIMCTKRIYNIYYRQQVFHNNVKGIYEFKKIYSRTKLIRLEIYSIDIHKNIYILRKYLLISIDIYVGIFINTYYCSRCFENCTVEQLDELEEHYM